MRGKYFVVTALVFTCGAGVGSWQAATQIGSRIKASMHLAAMAQSNAEDQAKASELALGMSKAAERIAWEELALERKRRQAAEQALDKALKAKLEDSTRQEQANLDIAKVQLSATTKPRTTRIARRIRFRSAQRRRYRRWRR